MKTVSVNDMAKSREERVLGQRALLNKWQMPVLSLSMNIAGPVKTSPLLERGFDLMLSNIKSCLQKEGISIVEERETRIFTGCSWLAAVNRDALTLKRLSVALEDKDGLGRLMDLDVIDIQGQKVDRFAIGQPMRTCLICDKAAAVCARSRAHSYQELFKAAEEIIRTALCEAIAFLVGDCAVTALKQEVDVTPKPGLVDKEHTGIHNDMDVPLFYQSADCLRSYFESCTKEGYYFNGNEISELMPKLRALGLQAEKTMLQTTKGVNTHQGAIYALGIVCGAVGLELKQSSAPDVEEILKTAGKIAKNEKSPRKLLDARTQAALGYPTVRDHALPAYHRGLEVGLSHNDAAIEALIACMAEVDDTNVLRRGGGKVLLELKRMAKAKRQTDNPKQAALELDTYCLQKRVSPGGCADLLALTLFLNRLKIKGGHI
ncbi:MAG: citrate lyase holo-[acyl-carrier protein] synthase [Christensenellales bacterium]|jgi:holo-ACP synthase/triphosphoribosyl-dephospho-CoA synthase